MDDYSNDKELQELIEQIQADKDAEAEWMTISAARKKRKKKPDYRLLYIGGAGLIIIALVFGIIFGIKACAAKSNNNDSNISSSESVQESATGTPAETRSPEQLQADEREKQIASYTDLAIASVSDGGYVNIREQPDENSKILGKLYNHSACSVSESAEEWWAITSGGIEGYIKSDYLVTGDEAVKLAHECFADRVIVQADTLNVRSEASKESPLLDQIFKNERYEVFGNADGWIKIDRGYISADYVELKYCLNEARHLTEREQVLNQYARIGVSNVQNYLNIREKADGEAKIIGKLPCNSGADILGEEGDWYKIKSGSVTGFVNKEYLLTGYDAKAVALQEAEKMAICTTDVLNVRTEPSQDAKLWTQIIQSERYPVVKMLDGWVELDLGDTDEDGNATTAFASADYLEVAYALPEAVKFSASEIEAANSGSRRAQIVKYALQFVGNRYVWGGTSLTNGCDCSGFTMKVMANFGVGLPHYSVSQSQMGTKVTTATMKPGDLIFYAGKSGTINHVAIYIGNGQIVHAANRRSGIKISNYNYRTPVRIRNVLGD